MTRFPPLDATPWETVRLPAEDRVHLFHPLAPGQLRGVTWLAPVLLRLHELDAFKDATLARQKVAALFAGFITSQNSDPVLANGPGVNGILETGMEPGAMIPLPPGSDIRFADTPDTKDFNPFAKHILRAIAAGIPGLTYEALTGDLTAVNYSSIRAGRLEAKRSDPARRAGVPVLPTCMETLHHHAVPDRRPARPRLHEQRRGVPVLRLATAEDGIHGPR